MAFGQQTGKLHVVLASALEKLVTFSPGVARELGRVLRLFRLTIKGVRKSNPDRRILLGKKSPIVVGYWNSARGQLAEKVVNSRDLSAHEFSDIVLSPNRRGGFIVRKEEVLTPETEFKFPARLSYPGYEVGNICRQQGDSVWWRKPSDRDVLNLETGIFCGSLAPHNWFHWLIDTLPTVRLASLLPEKFSDYPLILPDEALQRPNWLQSLDFVAPGRRIEWVQGHRFYRFQKLVILDGITGAHPRPMGRPEAGRIWFHQEGLESYADYVRQAFGTRLNRTESPRGPEKIFLGRKQGTSRRYNQEEAFSVASHYGYEYVEMEEVSFTDSLKLFLNAKSIVGPHGAGWANLLFTVDEPKGLLWTWNDSRGDNWYENVILASNSRIKIWQLPGSAHPDPRIADYTLDTNELDMRLRAIETR